VKLTIKLLDAQRGYKAFTQLWQDIKPVLMAGKLITVTAKSDTRTIEQNSLMWSCLTDLSIQVTWPDGRRMTPTGWKDYFTGHIDGQEMFPNMEGNGFIIVGRGKSTSDMTIREMSHVIELAHLFGDKQQIKWSKTSLGRDWPEEVCEPQR
jgi:hypothetical protein